MDKKRAHLGCIDHLLDLIPYGPVPHEEITFTEQVYNEDYERSDLPGELYVPSKY